MIALFYVRRTDLPNCVCQKTVTRKYISIANEKAQSIKTSNDKN